MRKSIGKKSLILLLLSLLVVMTVFKAHADTMMSAEAIENSGVLSANDRVPIFTKADDSYIQTLYNYETGAESRLWGPSIDWNGQYYYLKENAARTVSYIFRNYGPNNRTTPFITINGKVSAFQVTSDASASYVYYRIEGEDAIYRLPLVRGASNPERRTFTFDGTGFEFASFSLAQDPNQFLLYSEADAGLKVSIGLFSFDGGAEPIRTWTCTLPQEWKDNYQPIGDLPSYSMTFEASTSKIWLVAKKTLLQNDGRRYNANGWFFSSSISGSGELEPYDPSPEIPNWSTGNLKLLSINRYGRLVMEHSGSRPGTQLSLREFDPASGQLKTETLTMWRDSNGTERPLNDFYSDSGSGSGVWHVNSYTIDGQGNLYLGYNRVYEDGSGDWQRIAIFASQASQIGTPEPDPSVNDGALFAPENLVLRSTLPSMPAGTQITGSRWEVDSLSDSTRIYTGNNTGSATTHKVQTMLPAGSYVWRVAYDWERAGIETVRGSTNWSKEAAIEVTNLRFTVTFDSQGGNYIAPIANIPYGTSIASPSDPARSGYTFDDWYSDADYQQPWDFSTAVTDNVTLYAKWIKDNSSGGCDSLSLGLGLLSLASLALLEKKHGQ